VLYPSLVDDSWEEPRDSAARLERSGATATAIFARAISFGAFQLRWDPIRSPLPALSLHPAPSLPWRAAFPCARCCPMLARLAFRPPSFVSHTHPRGLRASFENRTAV